MSVWSDPGPALVGVAIGALGTFIGVWISQRGEDWRAILTDRRKLRDDKAVRLRVLYAPLMEMTVTMRTALSERAFLRAGDTVEARDRRIATAASAAAEKLRQVDAALRIEPDAHRVLAAFMEMGNAVQKNNVMLDIAGSYTADERKHQSELIERTAKALQDTMIDELAELEQPLGKRPSKLLRAWRKLRRRK